MEQNLDITKIQKFIDQTFDKSIIPELEAYIKIPCKSPLFDKNWQNNKYLDKAVKQLYNWVKAQNITALEIEIINLPNRTPLIYIEIPANYPDKINHNETILLYGHMDKQPEFNGWDDDKSPWTPVIQDNKLYGRGGADDGYAIFSSITAIKALQEQNLPHSRCVIIIEGCEESGSFDLPYYIDYLKDKIKEPSLVICLDSGCGNYDQLWLTSSLRGVINLKLSVSSVTEGIHSGLASGIVPSSFRIARILLSKIEDEDTGFIKPDFLHTKIDSYFIKEAKHAADTLKNNVYSELPWAKNKLNNTIAQPVINDHTELLLNRSWRPTLSIIGAEGLPNAESAGNVLRPNTTLFLSFRIPPKINAKQAAIKLKKLLEEHPPYNANINADILTTGDGWHAPHLSNYLKNLVNDTSNLVYNKPAVCWGEGGTIPFMAMLGEKFPKAEFVITGLLGPKSNAHGPNEFLHIPMAKKLTCSVANLIYNFCFKNK
tara:strand:+ start:5939 stop:7399 length:1461 start_codon:yes stop_codon:yes gene_type:complete